LIPNNIVEYFKKNPMKILERDYQILFIWSLFYSQHYRPGEHYAGIISKLTSIHSRGFVLKLQTFLNKQIKDFSHPEQVQASVFLLYVQRILRRFDSEHFDETLPTLINLLKINALAFEERSVIYTEIIAAITELPSPLSKENIELLIESLAYLHEYTLPQKWFSPLIDNEVRKAPYLFEKDILGYLEINPSTLQDTFNKILKLIHPKSKTVVWTNESDEKMAKSGDYVGGNQYRFTPLNGEIVDLINNDCRLPHDILRHPEFRILFPNQQRAKRIETGTETHFTFLDQHNNHTKVSLKHDTLHVEQLLKDYGWVKFISKECLYEFVETKCLSKLSSRYLVDKYTHWLTTKMIKSVISEKDQKEGLQHDALLLLKAPTSNDIAYEAELNFISNKNWTINKIRNKESNLSLCIPSNRLHNFEANSYIQEWVKPNEALPVLLELPRFQLSFSRNDKNQYRCNQFNNNYYLEPNVSVSFLNPYKHYLVLINPEGKKLVILPNQSFKKPDEEIAKPELLLPTFKRMRELDRGDQDKPQQYFTYDVLSNGKLVGKSIEANIYLVQVLLLSQRYEAAAEYLTRFCNKLTPYSDEEKKLLIDIFTFNHVSQNSAGNACALRLYAGYILFKNHHDFQIVSPDINTVLNSYNEYLIHYNNATALKLTQNEELFILNKTTPEILHSNPILRARIQELQTFIPSLGINKKPLKINQNTPFVDYSFLHNIKIDAKKTIVNIQHDTITRYKLADNWLSCYYIAKSGTREEKKWLRVVLSFIKCSSDAKERNLYPLFELFLQCGMMLPDFPIYLDRDDYYKTRDLQKKWAFTVEILFRLESGDQKVEHAFEIPVPQHVLDYTKNVATASLIISTPVISLPPSTITSLEWLQKCLALFNLKTYSDADEKESAAEAWAKSKLEVCKKSEVDLRQPLEFICKDFEVWRKQNVNTQFSIKNNNLEELEKNLSFESKTNAESLKKLELDILARTNQLPIAGDKLVFEQLQRMAGAHKQIDLSTVIHCFAVYQKDPAKLRKHNSHLSDAQINAIYTQVNDYLILATQEQHRQRILKILKKDKNISPELIQKIGSELYAQRHDKVNEFPQYLVFEYTADILLKKEQVEKLETFLTKGKINPIMEMIMGSGKSKVLLPLLAQMLAKPGKLATLMVPQSLFPSVAKDTQKILQEAFGLHLRTIHFNRGTKITKQSLEIILRDMQSAIDNCEPLIITNKTFQCLMLKCLEAFDDFSNQSRMFNAWPEEIQLIRKILNLFSNSKADGCMTMIDEADSVMNVLRKVCFSMGQHQSPKKHEIRILLHITSMLQNNESLKKLARCESDPKPNLAAPPLTEDNYENDLKPVLAKVFLETLSQLKLEPKYEAAIKEFLGKLNAADQGHAIAYLCHDKKKSKSAQKYFDDQNVEMQEILRLAGQVIGQFLAHTLTRVHNQNYGIDIDSDSSIAIPFLSTNVPSKGSQFANPHITMLYTIQTFFKTGCSFEILKKEIARLQSQAILEINESPEVISIEDTLAWKKFQHFKGDLLIGFKNITAKEIELLAKRINADINLLCRLLEDLILPQMKLYSEQISCNPHNLISFLKNVSGFTGTLWNEDSMHHTLSPLAAEGISAKTYEILFRKSRDAVFTIQESSTLVMLESLKKQGKSFNVLIDAGGYFKQGTNKEIAQEISNFYDKPVVFYNQHGAQTVIYKSKETALAQYAEEEIEAMIVFLDQDHTTGADVHYKGDAVGLVTVGRHALERDLKQAVWRLRGLDKGQSVMFALSHDVETLVRQSTKKGYDKLRFDDILMFSLSNQSSQQSRDNIQGFTQQLWDIPQRLVFQIGLDDKFSPKHFAQIWPILRGLWITSGMHNASAQYGVVPKNIKKAKFLKSSLDNVQKTFEKLQVVAPWLKGHLKLAEIELEKLAKHVHGKLPDLILSPTHDNVDSSVEIEVEKVTQQEIQVESQIDSGDKIIDKGRIDGRRFYDLQVLSDKAFERVGQFVVEVPRFVLSSYLEQKPAYRKYANAFSDLVVSINIFAWPANNPRVEALQLFGKSRGQLKYAVVQENHVTIIDNEEAGTHSVTDIPAYQKEFEARDPYIYNYTLKRFNMDVPVNNVVLKKIVKAKFLSGDSDYFGDERKLLTEWLQEAGVALLYEFFFKHVLAGRPQARAAYEGSSLQKIFKELLKQ